MGLLKKKSKEAASRPARAGNSLMRYFVPSLLAAVLLILVVGFFAQQTISSASTALARTAAQSVAESVAAQLAGAISARRDLLALALSDGSATAALNAHDADAMRAVESDLQGKLPDVIQVRLLPAGLDRPDDTGSAPLGYAGLDLLRRAVSSGRSAAEVHQVKSKRPYLALALPVSDQGRNLGALFMAWDLRFLVKIVENSPEFPGRLQLAQSAGGDHYVLAQGPGRLTGTLDQAAVKVPESIWTVSYALAPESGALGDYMIMVAVGAAAVLVLLLAIFLQWRMLAQDLRADMSAVVNLGEAIKRREIPSTHQPRIAAAGDAIALLGQYARDSREAAPRVAPAQGVPVSAAGPAFESARSSGVEVEELDNDPAEPLAGAAVSVDIPESLFRAYDVRGVAGEVVTAPLAQLLGRAVATLIQEQGGQRVAVARDSRLSSPELSSALIQGLAAAGCDVLDIGPAPTPLLYFAMQTQGVDGGVMVTASHNPADYNGFKIVIGERVLDGDELVSLRQRMLDGAFLKGNGAVEQVDLVAEYTDAVLSEVQLARPLKIVVDAGNGVAGVLALATFEALGCEVVPLYCEPDGSFPNHHPDPGDPDNLTALVEQVLTKEADLGVAFDGDGDRLGLVDNTGGIIQPDSVLMLLAGDVLGRHPGVDVLYDVKSSRHLASYILAHGGRPIMWKSGHSRMRAKMLETGALLGGEFSGHLFIKERWYGFDDAIYAATRVLEILASDPRSANDLFAELPSSPATPEYLLMLEEGQSGELMRALDAHKVFDDARLVELDGLRVEFASGWGLIRASNTMPALTFRFEADDPGALEQIKERFRDLLRRVAPDLRAPF